MDNKYLKILELDKIQEMAVQRAVCDETKQRLQEELPLTGSEDVRYLLAQTDALATHLVKNGNPRISSCAGSKEAVGRAVKGGVLSMAELLTVFGALRNFSRLASWHSSDDEAATPVDDLFYTISPQPGLEKDIPAAILSETEMADTASDELYSLRRKIRTAENSIRDKLDGVIKSPNNSRYLQESIVSLRNGRYVVPVKAEHRGEISGVIHDVSSSGSTLFVEPSAVVEANAKIMQLRNQEKAEMDRILAAFSDRVADIGPFFEASYESMLEIDKRLAKAELGLEMRGTVPAVNEERRISLVKVRHPLLNRDTVVPVDIALGGDFDTMVITGPNTGGKTVTLKTAGLLCAMAQMGYLLPAHETSSVCVFKKFLADIGDEQSIEQNLSTFSGHMRNITGILADADRDSLVLLDELGAGTDPAEGAALAVSIIEALRDKSALIMATTHYAELKMFALETAGVQNAGSEFNVETLRPTYKLLVGIPGRSNAFLISEKLGVPGTVIENARRHLSSEQQRFETVLTQLEDSRLKMHEQEQEIERLKTSADRQLELAKEKRDALIKQGEQELEQARQQAKALSDEVENKAYGLLDELKRLEKEQRTAGAQKARRAREIARAEADALRKKGSGGVTLRPAKIIPLTEVEAGQEVYIPDLDKQATVTGYSPKSGEVELRMGAIKTKYPLAKLSALPKGGGQNEKPGGYQPGGKTGDVALRTPATELNLLGKTVDEALMETDQFIDNAVMSGLSTVYIIHGRGTGALRSAISKHLRGNRSVKQYRLGRYGEGEDGVTVVDLK